MRMPGVRTLRMVVKDNRNGFGGVKEIAPPPLLRKDRSRCCWPTMFMT